MYKNDLYLANKWYSLESYDISNPAAPVAEGYYFTGDMLNSVSAFEDYIYAADNGDGVFILKNEMFTRIEDTDLNAVPGNFILHPNFPNPFNPSTAISYSLPGDGQISLKIFDLKGREVAELINGFQSAGTHQINWNAAGFPSGVYLARIKAGKHVKTRKLVLQK